jgi:hypothetical protein
MEEVRYLEVEVGGRGELRRGPIRMHFRQGQN